MHVGIASTRWQRKRSRYSRRMRNPQFYVSGKRPMVHVLLLSYVSSEMMAFHHHLSISIAINGIIFLRPPLSNKQMFCSGMIPFKKSFFLIPLLKSNTFITKWSRRKIIRINTWNSSKHIASFDKTSVLFIMKTIIDIYYPKTTLCIVEHTKI